MEKEKIVHRAKECPLRYGDENGQHCVFNDLECESYRDAFPTDCPILDDTVIISRQKGDKNE